MLTGQGADLKHPGLAVQCARLAKKSETLLFATERGLPRKVREVRE